MPPLRTTEQIISDLNGNWSGGTWVEIPDLLIVPTVVVMPGQVNAQLNSGMVAKAFLNTQSAEVKIFLAKATQIPEQPNL
jgi:hypothetical protein